MLPRMQFFFYCILQISVHIIFPKRNACSIHAASSWAKLVNSTPALSKVANQGRTDAYNTTGKLAVRSIWIEATKCSVERAATSFVRFDLRAMRRLWRLCLSTRSTSMRLRKIGKRQIPTHGDVQCSAPTKSVSLVDNLSLWLRQTPS